MEAVVEFLKKYKFVIAVCLVLAVVLVVAELLLGRSVFGPDGKFGWFNNNVLSNENSQRLVDAYSLTHILHGIIFYFLLWLVARKLPARSRFLIAILMEVGWEIVENSPLIINRYRMGAQQGYVGDSILNSSSDVIMMMAGFWFASYFKPKFSVVLLAAIEIILLFWIRDNLTINFLMLFYPSPAIKAWQLLGQGV